MPAEDERISPRLRIPDPDGAIIAGRGHSLSVRTESDSIDGVSMAPTGRALQSRPHPRSYGAYPRVLGYYARERKLFELPTAVRKMTSLPADQVGLADRGRIARGKKADLVLFDATAVKDGATFEEPHRFPQGIVHVLVNGVPVVEKRAHTGARPGRVLRKA